MPTRRMRALPVVTPAWAFTDTAADATVEALLRALARADGLRRCTPAEVADVVDRRVGFVGRGRLRRAVGSALGTLSHSRTEARGRRLLCALGLGFLDHPHPIVVDGRVIAEVDVAIPPLRYGVAIDRPHHLFGDQPAIDRASDRMLARHGWVIDRFLTTTVDERPRQLVHEVRQSVQARACALGLAT